MLKKVEYKQEYFELASRIIHAEIKSLDELFLVGEEYE